MARLITTVNWRRYLIKDKKRSPHSSPMALPRATPNALENLLFRCGKPRPCPALKGSASESQRQKGPRPEKLWEIAEAAAWAMG